MKLKIKRLSKNALLPAKKYSGDAGYDLYVAHDYFIYSFEEVIIPLDIAIEIPDGYVGLIKEKSGQDFHIGAGVVDSNYRGELKIKLRNPMKINRMIFKNQPIAQLLIVSCPNFEVEEVEELSETERGEKGGINRL